VVCTSLRDFALYVGFFPQLVAGPIERPGRLLAQLTSERHVRAHDIEVGIFLFASGWFRKSLGDVMASVSDPAFADPLATSPWILLWGAYAFAFQIYLDFSGYTNMARGVARCFGIELMENFRAPYFAYSLRDFWRRWHISLSTWMRDYVYISLGGRHHGEYRAALSLLATMLVSGLWHGAAWNFVFWGGLHGVFLLCGRLVDARRSENTAEGSRGIASAILARLRTFHLVVFAFIFFRARPIGDSSAIAVAFDYIGQLGDLLKAPFVAPPALAWMVSLVIAADVLSERSGTQLFVARWPWVLRAVSIALLGLLGSWAPGLLGFVLGSGENRAFIYFQF
jgi:D-alanyl-lipoteichoic acid acyltransferase DltB (MBOAT superfamily)